MHFALPSNLQQELIAYDPKLKVLAKKEQPKKNSTKPKFPLGKIPHLIPTNVVRAELQDDAIERINTLSVSNRYHTFTKVVDIATPEARTITTAILYHYEQCWYAGWLPAKGEEDDYVYGYAYAFKNVKQISGVANQRLTDEQREQYSLAFKEALRLRSEQVDCKG